MTELFSLVMDFVISTNKHSSRVFIGNIKRTTLHVRKQTKDRKYNIVNRFTDTISYFIYDKNV